jgi:chromosome segregation ATPase
MDFHNNPCRYTQTNSDWLIEKWKLGGHDTSKILSRISPIRIASRLKIIEKYPGFGCYYLGLTMEQSTEQAQQQSRVRRVNSKFSDAPDITPAPKRFAIQESISKVELLREIKTLRQNYYDLQDTTKDLSKQLYKQTDLMDTLRSENEQLYRDLQDTTKDLSKQLYKQTDLMDTLRSENEQLYRDVRQIREFIKRENATKTACKREVQEQLDSINASLASIVSDHRGILMYLQKNVDAPK